MRFNAVADPRGHATRLGVSNSLPHLTLAPSSTFYIRASFNVHNAIAPPLSPDDHMHCFSISKPFLTGPQFTTNISTISIR